MTERQPINELRKAANRNFVMNSVGSEMQARRAARRRNCGARNLLPALAALLAAWLAACAGSPDQGTTTARGPARPGDTPALDEGKRLYQVSCSGCHGAHARGNGPVAPLLQVSVPDLTLLASRRGGSFPVDEVYRIIDGQADLTAHGPRHMPVWGYEFFGESPDDEAAHQQATEKIDRLVRYLQSIQRTG
jgi:mono/diheme cytochrome c family protein